MLKDIIEGIQASSLIQHEFAEWTRSQELIDDPVWFDWFLKYFVLNSDPSLDDMLFFVRKSHPENEGTDRVFVRRKEKDNMPSLDDVINWQETFFLNVIAQTGFEFSVSVCRKSMSKNHYSLGATVSAETSSSASPSSLLITKQVTKRVYASPSKTGMAMKGNSYSCCYPLIYFTVDDFEEVFGDLIIASDEYICVELTIPELNNMPIFQGAVSFSALEQAFFKHNNQAKSELEYILMKGPNNKGHAQVAIRSDEMELNKRLGSTWISHSIRKISQKIVGSGVQSIEKFICCLTFVNMKWDLIIKDILSIK